MKRAVLLVTRSDDNDGVARVARAVEQRGLRAIRLDTDRYPHAVTTSTRIESAANGHRASTARTLNTSNGRFDLEHVDAVWYRRFAAGTALPDALDDERAACVDESRRALHGMIAALPCRHVDALESVRRCDHKELQLIRARALGLDVPRTLFSNEPAAVRAFFDECRGDVVTKMQSSFAIMRDEREHVVFTSAVQRGDLEDLDGLAFCPMIFQERLDRLLDVRATVVGDRVLAASLEVVPASNSPDDRVVDCRVVDWRVDGAARLDAWVPYTLPRGVERSLLRLVREIGLTYAACDFVVTRDERTVFLEVNAAGEWLWLDDKLGIADAIAAVLTQTTKRAGAARSARRRRALASTR